MTPNHEAGWISRDSKLKSSKHTMRETSQAKTRNGLFRQIDGGESPSRSVSKGQMPRLSLQATNWLMYFHTLSPGFLAVVFSFLLISGCASKPDSQGFILTGKWTGKAFDGTRVEFHFLDERSIIWFVDERTFLGEAPNGLRAKYSIVEARPYWELDIYEFEHARFKGVVYRAILEPLGEKAFRLEGLPFHMAPRPSSFGKEAIVFSKLGSD